MIINVLLTIFMHPKIKLNAQTFFLHLWHRDHPLPCIRPCFNGIVIRFIYSENVFSRADIQGLAKPKYLQMGRLDLFVCIAM